MGPTRFPAFLSQTATIDSRKIAPEPTTNMDAIDAAVERAYLEEHPHSGDESDHSECEDADLSNAVGSMAKNDVDEEIRPANDHDDIQSRRRAILDKIALFERRGAILPTDAHTLRFQVHESTSGQWRAVEERLQQLAFSWNPYQDYDADERRKQEHTSPTKPKPHSAGVGAGKRVARSDPAKRKKKKDFYELLQLSGRDASSEEIKKQFRKLALQLHPDKQQQLHASGSVAVEKDSEQNVADTTEFARLRVAYETLSDPDQRAAYDAKLEEMETGASSMQAYVEGIHVKDQIALEASTDFASLEWMARVKHKMDVMDRIAEWAKLLQIRANELRFETGEPCIGTGCGKIVSMDRDLECYGSPRRRVYICLLHKYIHACDESCTSHYGDAELDQKVCKMRAYWLVQNWLFETLQQQQIVMAHRMKMVEEQEETKGDQEEQPASSLASQYELVPSEIHLGDGLTTFSLAKASECGSHQCRTRFQFLENGIFVCRRHGTPHVCTFEQCERQELRAGKYVCWVSGKVYGHKRDEAGTGVRTRRVVYTDRNGESSSIDMEVPVLLPLGKMTSYLLEGGPKSAVDRSSSLSPPPPAEKVWSYCEGDVDDEEDTAVSASSQHQRPRRAMTVASYKRAREDEMSPTRARIRRRLNERVNQSDTSFYIYLHVPQAVANLPKVALELQEQMPIPARGPVREGDNSGTNESNNDGGDDTEESIVANVLPIRVQARHTLNYIKYWMEELTEQLISIWDQQIFWSDTLIGDEAKVMTLEEHGIHDGVALELRLHDDCPLLVGNWTGKQTEVGEYNTVQISKEAEEDLDEEQEEQEILIEAEEKAFEEDALQRKRKKMEEGGAIHHTEVIEFNGTVPRLMGVIPERARGLKRLTTGGKSESKPIKVENLAFTPSVETGTDAMRRASASAVALKRQKK